MTEPLDIIKKYYKPGTPLYETLVIHSVKVRDKALECIDLSLIHICPWCGS